MRFKRFFNIHTILLIVVFLTVAVVVIRFMNWGVKVNPDDFESEYTEEYKDNMDMIFPALDENGQVIKDKDGVTTIVCFGNAPFADDRDSKDNLANMIASKTGATVYNCSIAGSYLAMQNSYLDAEDEPMDLFCFYWMIQLVAGRETDGLKKRWSETREALGSDIPAGLDEVYETLLTLDFNTVDVVTVMYDATDYLEGHRMCNENNPTDVYHFTGNLEAGIELLHELYPHIRIIVMSPAYAFAVDGSGKYVSSDKYTYGDQDVLSTYVIKEGAACVERDVTFLDHIYGTITEDNASEYLVDNLHLNIEGRRLVADRFIHALQFYDGNSD